MLKWISVNDFKPQCSLCTGVWVCALCAAVTQKCHQPVGNVLCNGMHFLVLLTFRASARFNVYSHLNGSVQYFISSYIDMGMHMRQMRKTHPKRAFSGHRNSEEVWCDVNIFNFKCNKRARCKRCLFFRGGGVNYTFNKVTKTIASLSRLLAHSMPRTQK